MSKLKVLSLLKFMFVFSSHVKAPYDGLKQQCVCVAYSVYDFYWNPVKTDYTGHVLTGLTILKI